MSDESIEAYLNEHIPYRMSIIDAFCMTMMQHLSPAEVNGRRIGFASDEVRLETYSGSRFIQLSQLSNLTIESGLIAARTMMQFFGITADPQNSNCVQEYSEKPNGYDFRFKAVETDLANTVRLTKEFVNSIKLNACAERFASFDLARELNTLLTNANKASAHLTIGDKPTYTSGQYYAAIAVLVFIEDLVYLQFGRQLPCYAQWTDRLLEPPVLDLHREMKQQLRVCLRKSMYPTFGM
jgi:hypothetical protein